MTTVPDAVSVKGSVLSAQFTLVSINKSTKSTGTVLSGSFEKTSWSYQEPFLLTQRTVLWEAFMKLIGNLKKKVENAKTKEEARDTIKKAGMLLDEDELEEVSGGSGGLDYIYSNTLYYIEQEKCRRCGSFKE